MRTEANSSASDLARAIAAVSDRFDSVWAVLPNEADATLADAMFAYYDSDADIAWLPTGESDDVVSERVPGGLRDYDRTSNKLVAIEVWDARTRLPASILEALPTPSTARGGAA